MGITSVGLAATKLGTVANSLNQDSSTAFRAALQSASDDSAGVSAPMAAEQMCPVQLNGAGKTAGSHHAAGKTAGSHHAAGKTAGSHHAAGKTAGSHHAAGKTSGSHHGAFARGPNAQPVDRSLADVAEDTYNDPGGGVRGWHRLGDAELRKLGLDPAKFKDDKNHFYSYLYTDGNGHYALAFRGTEFKNWTDWKNNIEQGTGHDAAQYDDALNVAKQVTERLGSGNVVMVGHSKGGGEAEAAAIETGSAAVTFNSAGVSDDTIRRLHLDPTTARAQLAQSSRNYVVYGDILTGAQEHVPKLPRSSSHQIYLPDPDPERKQRGDERVTVPKIVSIDAPELILAYQAKDAARHGFWLHGQFREAMDRAAATH
jgi:hypothetical protein